MLASYYIYTVVLLILLIGALIDRQSKHISGWLSIIVCSIILGFRYNVGIDYLTYLDYYRHFQFFGAQIGYSREYGYDLLNDICASFGFGPGIFFSLTVFIQLILIYYTFRGNYKILPLIVFFYMTSGQLFGSLNIIRQAIAFSIFLYSIKFIEQKHLIKYLIGIALSTSVHTSSLILIPIYWLPSIWNKTFDKLNGKWQAIIFIGISIIAETIFTFFLSSVSDILSNSIYFNYVPNLGERRMRVSTGAGILLFTIIDIILILYSHKITSYYPKAKIFYVIYFVGIILSKIFGTDMLLSRVAYDFVSIRFVMLSFLVLYLSTKKTMANTIIKIGVIFIFLLVWIVDIYNGSSGCSPYQFIYENR